MLNLLWKVESRLFSRAVAAASAHLAKMCRVLATASSLENASGPALASEDQRLFWHSACYW